MLRVDTLKQMSLARRKKSARHCSFEASDGTLKNLASSVDSQLSDKRQHLLEVPESSPEDIVNVPVQLPLLFRGNLGYSQRPTTHSPSAGDEKSRSRSAITAPTDRDIRQHDIKRNSFVHSQKTKKNGRSSEKANAEEILKTLQSLPRPSTVPHKPLQQRKQSRVAKAADAGDASSHQQETFWAPSSIYGMAHLKPKTPTLLPVYTHEQAPQPNVASSTAMAGRTNKPTEHSVATVSQRRHASPTSDTTSVQQSLSPTKLRTHPTRQRCNIIYLMIFSDTCSDVASVVELRKHEPTLRPGPLQYAMARGTAQGRARDETVDVSTTVSKVMRKSGALIMKRKHKARSDAHRMASIMDDDIKAIRSTLPASFLFEHNMSEFIVERGLEKIRAVIQRIRMRAVAVAWQRWRLHTEAEAEKSHAS